MNRLKEQNGQRDSQNGIWIYSIYSRPGFGAGREGSETGLSLNALRVITFKILVRIFSDSIGQVSIRSSMVKRSEIGEWDNEFGLSKIKLYHPEYGETRTVVSGQDEEWHINAKEKIVKTFQ